MATFGESLRRERELRGITLPELSNATKISVRYLRAIENNQFDRLPGGIFNRGFVRAIARYMRADENHWVGEYVRAAHEEPETVARYVPPAQRNTAAAATRAGVWSLVVLVAAFGISAYVVHEIRAQRAAEANGAAGETPAAENLDSGSLAPSAPLSSPPAAPAASRNTSRARAAGSTPDGSPAAASSAGLHLQVDVLDAAWLNISLDGEPAFSGTLHPGESRTFRAHARIELATGNASAVVLTLNGETLAPLGNPGEVKRVSLTAKDLQPATP